ncbi:hypothetical protein JCM10213_007181 [Rhodosporidiobolus nylandii]
MSPFNCFAATGHDDTLPRGYAPQHLPPLQASPPRSPSRRVSLSSRGRRSLDGRGGEKQAMKMRIGAPTGFRHVSHVGGDGAFGGGGEQLASSLAAITSALSPPRAPVSAPSSSPPSPSFPSSPLSSRPQPAERGRSSSAASPLANKHFSLPSSSVPFADASNRSPAPSSPSPVVPKQRPASQQPPVRRKAAPPVTASVIRAVPGGAQEVAKSGPVPALAKVPAVAQEETKPKGSTLALQELFTPSEIKAIQHYQAPSPTCTDGQRTEEKEGGEVQPGTQTKIFNGAMREIEAALKQAD